jgi:hypothetical protein
MQFCKIGSKRRQPRSPGVARLGIDQERRADLDDDAAEIFERGAFHGFGRMKRIINKEYAPPP